MMSLGLTAAMTTPAVAISKAMAHSARNESDVVQRIFDNCVGGVGASNGLEMMIERKVWIKRSNFFSAKR